MAQSGCISIGFGSKYREHRNNEGWLHMKLATHQILKYLYMNISRIIKFLAIWEYIYEVRIPSLIL